MIMNANPNQQSIQNYDHLLQFKSTVLVKGQKIEAYVVSVEDGPLSFYVMQRIDYEKFCPLLVKKMKSFTMFRIRNNIIPGRPCLAYDLNNVLCRGVIVAINDSGADIYFVDFGYTHGVCWNKIYDIHSELVLPKTMAVRLKLSKLTQKFLTDDAKRIFTELLTDCIPFVLLDVSESEEPGVQFAEVYIEEHGKFLNIKEKMMASFHKIFLSSGDTYKAVVIHCSSVNNIYVRLLTECNVAALHAVMSELKTYYSDTSTYLSLSEMYVGRPVAVLDSDNEWYRAVIMVEPNDYKTISVYFVDYGKYAVVHGQNLQALNRKFLKLRAQAIHCNMFENSDDKINVNMDEFKLYLDFLIGSQFILKVQNVSPDGIPIVQLIDHSGCSAISLFQEMLQSPLNSSPSSDKNDVEKSANPCPVSSCNNKEINRADVKQKVGAGSTINNCQDEYDVNIKSNIKDADKKSDKKSDTNVSDISNNGNRLNEQSCENKPSGINLYVERWLQTNDFSAKDVLPSYEHDDDWKKKSSYKKIKRKTYCSKGLRKLPVEPCTDAKHERRCDDKSGHEARSPVKSEQKMRLVNSRSPECKFFEMKQTLGSIHQVVVGQFNNPHSFYAHIISFEYEDMMNDMQKQYPNNREPLRKDEIYVGDTVVVAEQNGMLKRARVISLINTEKYIKVNFVDYGNDYDCISNNMWAISAEHCELPITAICCRLNNVIPPIGNNWCNNFDSQQYFSDEKFTLKIVDQFTDELGRVIYEVELFDLNGRDVAERLINDCYCRTRSGLEEPIDLDVLTGQYTTLYVPWYESAKKFAVQLEPETVTIIENRLKEISNDTITLSKLSDEEITYETYCLVWNESLYNRGLILSVNHDVCTVKVLYIDYGHEDEVSWDKLFVLQKNLTYYHGQAYHCSLYNTETLSQHQNDTLKNIVEKQYLIGYVNKVHDHKLLLTLYRTDGTPLIVINSEHKESISPLIPLRILRPQTMITITNVQIEEGGVVTAYIMHQYDKSVLEKLQKSLHDFYSGQAPILNDETLKLPIDRCEIGTYCICSTSRWPHWRRCKIMTLCENRESNVADTKVLFVDYGSEMYVKRCSSLFTLNDQFYSPNELCLKVNTGLIVKNEDEATSRNLIKNLTNAELTVEFSGRSMVAGLVLWNIQLADNEYVAERLPGLTAYKNFDETTEIDSTELDDGDIVQRWFRSGQMPVQVVHAESPTSFWIRLTEDLPQLDELESSLQERLKTILPTPLNNLNEMFAFKQKNSNVWHRGVCPSPAAVHSVDSGYLLTDVDELIVKILPYRFKRAVLPFSVECSLDVEVHHQQRRYASNDETSVDIEWSAEALKKFRQLTKGASSETHSPSLTGEIVAALKDGRQIIRLLSNSTDVGLTLINENLAVAKCHPVMISEITSVERFFTVNEESLDEMDKLFEQLNLPQFHQREPYLTKEKIECGDIVLAKSPKTAQWLRAIVLSIGVDGDDCFVESIDIGRQLRCSQIKRLPRRFGLIPAFATECSLNVSELQETTSDAIDYSEIEQFIRYHSRQWWAKFTMICRAYESPRLVDLYVNNNDIVADVFFQKDQMAAVAEDSTFSANFIISHSPGDFYIQLTKNTDAEEMSVLLRNMVDRCLTLDNSSAVVGSLVAAQFPDRDWYRAKLLKILPDSNGYEVISIDVGVTCTVSNIKVLPKNLVGLLPPLAIRCSLELPEECTDWPEWFCNQFEDFTRNRTELKIKLIKKGNPNFVSLPEFETTETDADPINNDNTDDDLVDDLNCSYVIDHDIPVELIKKKKKRRARKRRRNNSNL